MSRDNLSSPEVSEAYFTSVHLEKQPTKHCTSSDPMETSEETVLRAAELGMPDLEHITDLNIVSYYREAFIAIRDGKDPDLTQNELCRLHKQGFTALSYAHRGVLRRKLSPKCLALLAELESVSSEPTLSRTP